MVSKQVQRVVLVSALCVVRESILSITQNCIPVPLVCTALYLYKKRATSGHVLCSVLSRLYCGDLYMCVSDVATVLQVNISCLVVFRIKRETNKLEVSVTYPYHQDTLGQSTISSTSCKKVGEECENG